MARCAKCNGTGNCTVCKGRGTTNGGLGNQVVCKGCSMSGKCSACSGKG